MSSHSAKKGAFDTLNRISITINDEALMSQCPTSDGHNSNRIQTESEGDIANFRKRKGLIEDLGGSDVEPQSAVKLLASTVTVDMPTMQYTAPNPESETQPVN